MNKNNINIQNNDKKIGTSKEEVWENSYLEETNSNFFDFNFNYNKSEYKVSIKDKNNVPQHIIIPKKYQGLSVTHIETNGFANCEKLKSVLIPNTVIFIDDYGAFENCNNLCNIIFEKNSKLKYIGHSAFKNCNSLEKIIIPSNVIVLEEEAFAECTSLKEVFVTSKKIVKPTKNLFYNTHPKLKVYISEKYINIWKLICKYTNYHINIFNIEKDNTME